MSGPQAPGNAFCPPPDHLVLLVVDPYTIFAYWQVSGSRFRTHLVYLGLETGQLLLRVYRRRGEKGIACLREEGPLPLSGCLYLTGLAAGAAYQAELGVIASGNSFVALLTSQPVACPPSGKGDRTPDLATPPARQTGGHAVRGFDFELRS